MITIRNPTGKTMRAFKHVDPQYANSFESGGAVRVGTLGYYRGLEGERADNLEGATLATIPNLNSDTITSSQRRRLKRVGFMIEEGNVDLQITNCSSALALPLAFIFCASHEPDENLRERGFKIFEISDIVEFAHRVAGSIGEPHSIHVGPVRYERRSANLEVENEFLPDPFVKRTDLSWEKEIRVCWKPLNFRPDKGYAFNAMCPQAHNIIRVA